MSTVAPNGQVRLLANVPLDKSYENTLYFANETAQRTYFLGLTPVHSMTNATRVRDGVIAVNALEDNIRHCNYLLFQNQNFSTKWFYAFITGTEYVNNNTTYVYYSIDVIQTWLISGDVSLAQCIIERQHSTTDTIGGNIVGENMGASELKCNVLSSQNMTDGKIVVLNTSVMFDGGEPVVAPVGITDGIANQSLTYPYSYSDSDGTVSRIEQIIEALVEENQSDSIIGGFVLPKKLFENWNSSRYISNNGEYINDGDGTQQVNTITFNSGGAYSTLDGYSPKNKKMFTAPFNWVYLVSSDGQVMPLRPEYLTNRSSVSLKNYHCITGVPEARVVLQGYQGETEASEYYFAYTDFPQFSYAVDGYKAWLASGGDKRLELSVSQTTRASELQQSQTKFNAGINLVKDVGQVASGYVGVMTSESSRGVLSGVGQMAGGVVNGVSDVGNTLYQLEASQQTIQFANENADLERSIAKTLPNTVHGIASNTSLLGANNIVIKCEQRCVNYNIAKTIDDYFTMYGYAQNVVATPNIHARPHFTYVKTIGCKANGGAPATDIDKIQAIFNSGIRFWVNASEVGNYSVNNAPV